MRHDDRDLFRGKTIDELVKEFAKEFEEPRYEDEINFQILLDFVKFEKKLENTNPPQPRIISSNISYSKTKFISSSKGNNNK